MLLSVEEPEKFQPSSRTFEVRRLLGMLALRLADVSGDAEAANKAGSDSNLLHDRGTTRTFSESCEGIRPTGTRHVPLCGRARRKGTGDLQPSAVAISQSGVKKRMSLIQSLN